MTWEIIWLIECAPVSNGHPFYAATFAASLELMVDTGLTSAIHTRENIME